MAYAETTTVPFEKSVAEIVRLLRKMGASHIGQMEDTESFALGFEMAGRKIRFVVHFPDAAAIARLTGPRQDPRKVEEQWRRQRGRALLLVIKAKLESAESGVETLEQAFLANVVMLGGATVYDRISERIEAEYAGGKPVPLLGGPTA